MKRITSTFIVAMFATISFSQVKINELLANPPGTDNGLEFMELKGPANGRSMDTRFSSSRVMLVRVA